MDTLKEIKKLLESELPFTAWRLNQNDDRRHNIGQRMADEDPALAGSNRQGCLEVVVLLDGDDGTARHPGIGDAGG